MTQDELEEGGRKSSDRLRAGRLRRRRRHRLDRRISSSTSWPESRARIEGAVASSEATGARLKAAGDPSVRPELRRRPAGLCGRCGRGHAPSAHDQGRRRCAHPGEDRGGGGEQVRLHCRRSQAEGRAGRVSAAGGSDSHGAFPCRPRAGRGSAGTRNCDWASPRTTAISSWTCTAWESLNPVALEGEINQIVGVVANGLFARRGADVLLLGTRDGVDDADPVKLFCNVMDVH